MAHGCRMTQFEAVRNGIVYGDLKTDEVNSVH
jgi:hypothetical protein